MPRKKQQSNGFILGNQAAFANAGKHGRAQSNERNKDGSWWVGLDRTTFTDKAREVFPEMAASVEGQKPRREWKG